jgi:hypothetical protein
MTYLNKVNRNYFFNEILAKGIETPYLCNVFFMVLDLRLTRIVVVVRQPFLFLKQIFWLTNVDHNHTVLYEGSRTGCFFYV